MLIGVPFIGSGLDPSGAGGAEGRLWLKGDFYVIVLFVCLMGNNWP